MDIKQRWLLLSATPYRVVDEKNGQVNEGVSIFYLPTDNLTPLTENHAKGLKPGKCVIPSDKLTNIPHAPAFYDFSLNMKMGADMKAQLKVTDVTFASFAEMKPLTAESGTARTPSTKAGD